MRLKEKKIKQLVVLNKGQRFKKTVFEAKSIASQTILCGLMVFSVGFQVQAKEDAVSLPEMKIIGISPVHGSGLPKNKIPGNIQTVTSEDIDRSEALDVSSFLSRNLSSVNLNAAQNNPLQPDLNYRGYSASPLLGLPQGLSIFINGARFNDPFGDNVNWDLIPKSMIHSINLVSGANPVFGLNTLGGAISIQTKNGFNSPGHKLEVFGGSFDRVVVSAESGGSYGDFAYFVNVRYFDEQGWRDASPSDALNIYGTVGWHTEESTLDLGFLYGKSDLIGNGAIPLELALQDRSAIFTSPDITENDMKFLTLEGTHWVNDKIQLAGNAYWRETVTKSFNGDDSGFIECKNVFRGGDSYLANGEDFTELLLGFLPPGTVIEADDAECDGVTNFIPGTEDTLLTDQNGNLIPSSEDRPLDAINNISTREQTSFGVNLQSAFNYDIFGHGNHFIFGGSFNRGLVDYRSRVEVAHLQKNRSTDRTGIFVAADALVMNGSTRTWSWYFSDTLDLTETLAFTVAGRYNHTKITLNDKLGNNPELYGIHYFDRFNPSVGLTWQAQDNLNFYGSYSESTRTPTIIELACSDPNNECRLPNAFLADPPLDQVVAKSFEAGVRGSLWNDLAWNVTFFHTINKNDIIFQSTGGATSNIGFFDNIGDTRRLGVEVNLRGKLWDDRVNWYTNYSFIDATFQDSFTINSPTHPNANDSGLIQVDKGDRIPGIPQHQLNAGLEVTLFKGMKVGADILFNSGQHVRGDEGNYLSELEPYWVLNLHGSYAVTDNFSLFVVMENVADNKYESFGLLGESNELPGFENFTNPRFVGPAPPFGVWGGIRVTF